METFIQKLESFDYEQLLDWLASTLAGDAPLSGGITPDKSPAADLHHLFKDVQGHAILARSVERAVRELLDRFAAAPGWDKSGYQKQLLLLAGFMEIEDTAPRLAPLVRDTKRFHRLPPIARRIILNTLHDLPGSDDPALWMAASKVDPAMLGPISFSALLRRHKIEEAVAIICALPIPNEPAIGRSLGTRLRLITPELPNAAKSKLIDLISNLKLPKAPAILAEIRQWLETQPSPPKSTMFRDLRILCAAFHDAPLPPGPAKLCEAAA